MTMARRIGIVMTAGLLMGAVGCSTPQLNISGQDTALPSDDGSAAYLDRVSSMSTVSQNDAMRGILMLLDVDDANDTFAQRVEKLTERDVVGLSWRFQADRPITRGQVAYMLYQMLDVPGGVILALTGPSQRYCLKELQYHRIISSGAAFAGISGGEYIAVLGRADAYAQHGDVPEINKTR